ncbi:hypothetical protein UR09_01810 [Candidatus Nitromaritima sp. SCGC AAA799-A02]|nr:hypothetical protein UR09_01810 [Candidatus Nitromaritima sp. SCGC AAA799-A02]
MPGGIISSTSRFNNVGNGIYFGINLGADYRLHLGRADWKFWGNYSWTDGRIEKLNGETTFLPNISRHKIKSGLTFRYDKNYYITPRLNWIGRASGETRPLAEVSSYALFNLHLGVDNIIDGLSGFLTITNLPNVRFFNVGGGTNSFTSSPQDPRRFFLGFKYKL